MQKQAKRGRILPFVASPYFLLRKCTPRRVPRQRPVARLYASVNFSANESATAIFRPMPNQELAASWHF